MIILGISEQHEAHACLMIDGEVRYVIAEERISRLKTDSGFPIRAINKIFQISNIDPNDIDRVAFASSSRNIWTNVFKKHALFEVEDWIQECEKYWKPVLIDGRKDVSRFDYWDFFARKKNIDFSKDIFGSAYLEARSSPQKSWQQIGFNARCAALEQLWGIERSKVREYRHEDCHKAYGYFASPFVGKDALVFTLEGGGDDSSATLSKINKNGKINELWASNDVMIGRLYAYITLILGMKPGQHEYKVMGLAPYGNRKYANGPLSVFRKINKVSDSLIENCNVFPDLYFSMLDELKYFRFDNIACALQLYLEETVCAWVKNSVKQHGIKNIIISGGVGQNIKLAKALTELVEVEHAWHPPIAGDGSLGVGAAWLACEEFGIKQKQLTSVYLGTQYNKEEIDISLKDEDVSSFHLVENYTLEQAAEWLASGNICARFSGKMEFGQRALGNRSIIADPRDYQTVKKINDKIKYRDFWMPFTPSILDIEVSKFLKLEGKPYSPFMTKAFDSLEDTRNIIPGVIHPADYTVRPQILTEEHNASYYKLIQAFKALTGVGVLLNTSFNLHGYPIVESPTDAIKTFKESDLDILLFDHVAVIRKEKL